MLEKNYIKSTRPMSKAEKVLLGLEVGCYILGGSAFVVAGLAIHSGVVGSIWSVISSAAILVSSQAFRFHRGVERLSYESARIQEENARNREETARIREETAERQKRL